MAFFLFELLNVIILTPLRFFQNFYRLIILSTLLLMFLLFLLFWIRLITYYLSIYEFLHLYFNLWEYFWSFLVLYQMSTHFWYFGFKCTLKRLNNLFRLRFAELSWLLISFLVNWLNVAQLKKHSLSSEFFDFCNVTLQLQIDCCVFISATIIDNLPSFFNLGLQVVSYFLKIL